MKYLADKQDTAFCLGAIDVDQTSGILRGVTVAKAGVQAKGKFVFLDAAGNVTRNQALAKSRLPVFTDDEFLETLMGAAQDAGGSFKIRSDHDDSLKSRAGAAKNFRKIEDRVVCDLHLNKSYRDRDIVLETALKNPELIGCSIDFVPSFVVSGGKALMRVEQLSAVDIVDEGAVTPGGMFMKRGVDSESNLETPLEEPDPLTTMAKADEKKTPPTIDECMAAITEMAGKLAEFNTAMAAMKSAPAEVAKMSAAFEEVSTKLASISAQNEKLAKDHAEFVTAQNEKFANIARERQALGLKSGDAAKLAETAEQETERVRLAAERDADAKKPKTYLALVAAKKAEGKLSASECHRYVMTTNREAYEQHLKDTGVFDPKKAA